MSSATPLLVLAPDPMVAALVGLLAETAGFAPLFAARDEAPEAALARLRPGLVVVLDGGLAVAHSDLFFARAARQQVGVLLFGGTAADAPGRAVAARRGLPFLVLPADVEAFRQAVTSAGAMRWWTGSSDRRQGAALPRVEEGAGGALTYVDASGRRWNVYDRRGGQRRQDVRGEPAGAGAGAGAGDGAGDGAGVGAARVFVGESGEVREYPLGDAAPGVATVQELGRQLEDAVRM